MELKLPKSRTVMRKQTFSREMRPPRTVGPTMDNPWWPLFWHCSILSSFDRHSDLGISLGSQASLIYGQIWGKMVQKHTKHRKEPY